MAEVRPYTVIVAGHSFIRRMHTTDRVRGVSMDTPQFKVEYLGVGGGKFEGGKDVMEMLPDLVLRHKPKLLYLELGSNDIHPRTYGPDVPLLAYKYGCKLDRLHARFPDLPIILGQVIPRHRKICSWSWNTTQRFNQFLSREIESRDFLHFWKHKGLNKAEGKHLDRDGIHLTLVGQIKLHFSIKRAIRFHVNKLGL